MKDTIRLFVAASIPGPVLNFLAKQLQPYDVPGVRILPRQNLHLTLYFIGEVPQEQLPTIKQTLQEVAAHHQPFTLQLEALEPGPKPRSPRLVWARFAQNTLFEQLSLELTQRLVATPPQNQKAIPHVTLARFRKDKPSPKHLPTLVPDEDISFSVDAISLWHSQLASPHPIYTVTDTFPLG